ncbi:ABC transporter permease [Mucilaginibacter conchicola]|uniref:ABC transporter permease n=1 Tax=Mucilaginibacter conchicola TaxID=2303333 RepID=A0A372NVP2_9SPHI|nr:ABC transporter permease [Mucilaginibacter conchicola]RFZ94198.1 ABC transporter permease [Mucilaginibacter conchicola]
MIKNYFKTAWRNLTQNKASSIINISGLAIGMAVSFTLLLYVYNEFSFDKFHANNERLYQVFKNQPASGVIKTKSYTPQTLAPVLQKDFPEIENTARMSEATNALVTYKNRSLKFKSYATDPSFMQLFSFETVYGDKVNPLADESSVVITQSAATALFADENPVGKVLQYNSSPLKVSAVIRDNPQNSSFDFKVLIPWQAFLNQAPWLKDAGWDNYSYATYVLLKHGTFVASVNNKIKHLIAKYYAPDKTIELFAYPFSKLHLYGNFVNGVNSGGNIEYVRLFLLLAIGMLFIACINFMNLSTARSEKRAREVGIRKVMGARRFSLIKQFMAESLTMAFSAFLISIILMILLLPTFNTAMHIQLSIPYTSLWAWMAAFAITIFTGVIAGSYPALFLSSFNPVRVLKGQLTGLRTAVKPRQVLVVMQFTFAVCLIVSSIFIYKQINYIANKPVGYNRNGLIELPIEGGLFGKFESFRLDAIKAGAITDGALISEPITKITGASWGNTWPGQLLGEDKVVIDCIAATYHFTDTYQLKFIQGRDFDIARPSDSAGVILNVAAVKLMRLKEPIGQPIKWMGANRTVIGVVKDFVWGSPYEPVKPTIIGYVKDWVGNIGLRLNPNLSASKSLALLESVYKKYNPQYPFEYTFTDEAFSNKFQSEKVLGAMALTFTSLAVIISCLELFGLASFSAEQRRKELSIRKVLGASVANLWFKLSNEFIKLVVISFFIGSALSWYYIHNWLNSYTYHADISVDVFGVTLIASLLICLLAVSWQAVKAAWVNPVKNLRGE